MSHFNCIKKVMNQGGTHIVIDVGNESILEHFLNVD